MKTIIKSKTKIKKNPITKRKTVSKKTAVSTKKNTVSKLPIQRVKKIKESKSLKAEKTFYDLFLIQLREIYNAKKQIATGLSHLVKNAHNKELKNIFKEHEKETNNQIKRLDKIFQILDETPSGETSEAMKGLLLELQRILKFSKASVVRDSGLIAVAQRIAHYEIASYGTIKAFAKQLNYPKIAILLRESLNEEVHEDQALSALAEGGFFSLGINKKAKDEL